VIAKEIMNIVSNKYHVSDSILEVGKKLLEIGCDGGLVYNSKGEIIGYFTHKELLNGVIKKYEILRDVLTTDFLSVDEDTLIQEIDFTEHELLTVIDRHKEVIGFILKSHYLEAIAKQHKIDSNRLDAIFNSAHNGILSINVEGCITAINPAAEKMSLSSKEQAIGKFLNDIVSPTGLLNVIRTGQGHSEKYTVGNRKYLAHRTPIYDGKKLVGAVGVFQEISEVEIISNELNSVKQLVNEMNTIINNSSDGICIVDSKGNIIQKNERFNNLYYDQLDEVEKRESFQKIIKEVVEKKKNYNTMIKNIDNNSIIITANLVTNEKSEVERVIFNVKDITEIGALRQEIETTQFILNNIQEGRNVSEFVVNSDSMKNLLTKVEQIAQTDVTVLLSGEIDVGKEEIAKLIVETGLRKNKPIIMVNCAEIPEQLLDSKLFGYIDGELRAMSKEGSAGYFEHADGGTLYLNQIEALPLPIQDKFLQLIESQTVTRVGSTKSKEIDVRIITATNENLEKLVSEGRFREDLFYKISVLPIIVPSLSERREDIPELIQIYFDKFSTKYKKNLEMDDDVIKRLTSYDWPENIRELENIIERLFVSTVNGVITLKQLEDIIGKKNRLAIAPLKPIIVNKIMPLKEAVEELERELISKVRETEDSYRKIAKVLEVNPSTIVRKLKKLYDK